MTAKRFKAVQKKPNPPHPPAASDAVWQRACIPFARRVFARSGRLAPNSCSLEKEFISLLGFQIRDSFNDFFPPLFVFND